MKQLSNIINNSSDDISSFLKEEEDNLLWESAGPSGGQVAGWGDRSIYLTHIPTGHKVRASAFRSQHQNRQLAVIKLIIKITENE